MRRRPAVGSAPEEHLALQLRAHGIPFEREVVLPELRPRRWRWDFVIGRLLIEVQGGVWVAGRHSRGAGQTADCEKLCSAVAAGYTVLTVVPSQVANGQALGWIREILGNMPEGLQA